MISYFLLGIGALLIGVVATSRSWLSPVIVAAAMALNLMAVEMAKGWPTTVDPPTRGILYAIVQDRFVIISEAEPGATPRLYDYEGVDGEGKQKKRRLGGPVLYDMSQSGAAESAQGNTRGGGITAEDMTELESMYGVKEQTP